MTERDPKELAEGVTRAELRAAEEAEEEKNPGYLARTRKATMAGACALATALSGAVLFVTQDGTLTTEEMLGSLVISLGVGASVWLATWATPNA